MRRARGGWVAAALAVWGGGALAAGGEARPQPQPQPQSQPRPQAFAAHTLAPEQIPAGVKRPKGLEEAVTWTDKNGENLLLRSSWATKSKDASGDVLPSAFLTVDHLLLEGGHIKTTLRSVRDGVEACPVDLTADFSGPTVVTDVDQDGIAEVTFAYAISCQGDVAPEILKLLVIENGDKYILRGETRAPNLDSGKMEGGKFKPDPPAARWPKGFLEHAKRVWKEKIQ